MKRKSLFNRIISLSIVAALYISMSASAFAEIEETEIPVEEAMIENATTSEEQATEAVVEEAAETSEESVTENIDDSTTETEATSTSPEDEAPTDDETEETPGLISEIIDSVKELISPTDEEAELAEEPESEEPAEGDTYFKIIMRDYGTKVKVTYEYVMNEETGELEAIVKDELEGEFDEDGNLIEKEEEEKPEHEFIYTSNKDGTHTVKCSECDMEEYIESCEYDENGVCIHCEWKRLPDPIHVYEDDEVIVTVSGAVPENADLKVTPIKKENEETKEAYESVEQRLVDETDIEEYDSYGFLAYDISFIEIETGNEIEPSDDVTVKMEYKQSVKPIVVENPDDCTTEVEMVHFNEEENKLENLTEEGRADLKLEDNSALTKVEFTSNSFSTYVIKWQSTINTKYVKIVTSYYTKDNVEMEEFSTDEITFPLSTESPEATVIKNSSFAPAKDGYRFLRAELKVNDEYKEIDRFKYRYSYGNKWIRGYLGESTTVGNEVELVSDESKATRLYLSIIYEKDAALSIMKKETGTAATDTDTEYIFKLLKADGTAVGEKAFFVGTERRYTDAEGKFLLKTGQSADFALTSTPVGAYQVIEEGVSGEAYTLGDFTTKTFVDGTEINRYDPGTIGGRKVDITVADTECTHVVYKNLLTYTEIDYQKPEELSKFIRYNGDDNYDLGVKFSPPAYDYTTVISNEEIVDTMEPTKVDIVLVVDKSGSMGNKVNGVKRIVHVKEAVETLRDVIQSKRNVDASWKVVYFDYNASGDDVNSAWRSNSGFTISTSTDGGTNYEAGLKRAKNITATKRAGTDKTIVIFLTDGEPTNYGTGQGYGSRFDPTAYFKAKAVARQLTCDSFYTIGVDFKDTTFKFTEEDGSSVALKPREVLERISEAASNVSDKSVSTVKSSEVVALFKNLAGRIVSKPSGSEDETEVKNRASNVTITDTLSEYAEAKTGSQFYISVDVDGVDIWNNPAYVSAQQNGIIGDADNPKGTSAYFDLIDGGATYHLTAEYDVRTKTVTLDFPDDYKVNPEFGYKVVFMNIIPTDLAYSEFTSSGYNAVGETDTDNASVAEADWTSEGKEGFRSNTEGKVVYDYRGEIGAERYFNHPVLQVHIKNVWEIYKTNEDGSRKLATAVFELKEDGTDNSYTGVSSSDEDKLGLIEWTLGTDQEIAVNKTYILSELAAPAGFAKSDETWKIQLDANNVPTVIPVNAEGVEQTQIVVEPEINRSVITYRFYFKNFAHAYELPETGGNGIYRTTALGLVFMMTSVFLFYRNRKKSKAFCKYHN